MQIQMPSNVQRVPVQADNIPAMAVAAPVVAPPPPHAPLADAMPFSMMTSMALHPQPGNFAGNDWVNDVIDLTGNN